MDIIVVPAQRLSDVGDDPIDKAHLSFCYPNHWNNAEVIDPQFHIVLVNQHCGVYLLGNFFHDVEVSLERFVTMLAQFCERGFEQFQRILDQGVVWDHQDGHSVLDYFGQEVLETHHQRIFHKLPQVCYWYSIFHLLQDLSYQGFNVMEAADGLAELLMGGNMEKFQDQVCLFPAGVMAGQQEWTEVKPKCHRVFVKHVDVEVFEFVEEVWDVKFEDFGNFLKYFLEAFHFHSIVVAKLHHHFLVCFVICEPLE